MAADTTAVPEEADRETVEAAAGPATPNEVSVRAAQAKPVAATVK
ncbi:hypothetical protein [Kitasatospora sp. MAP5-34]|nr:hypothetical protein [Kitasatospora sp. MAP5-34]